MKDLLEHMLKESEKEDWFEERTNYHINLVKKAAQKIVAKYPEFKDLIGQAAKHDASKFLAPERDGYVELSWRLKQNKNSYKTPGTIPEKDLNDATLHHILNNAHHPEFYGNKAAVALDPNDRHKSVNVTDASKMPDLAIAELCCDWQAMSEELKKNTARQWFNQTKNVRWKWSKHQEELIDKLLAVFE